MKKYILNDSAVELKTHVDFKGNLNEEQYKVVTQADGPSLVLAGAGSGKTRTLIYRLAYLLESGVLPRNILLMTFTNKAAREMQERAEMLLKYKPTGLWSGTFHHVGNRSLRMYADKIGFKKDFAILDQQDSRELIKSCFKIAKIKTTKEERFPKPSVVQSIISFSTNTNKTIKKVIEEKYPYFFKFLGEIKKISDMYVSKKKESSSMDYDDLLEKWRDLLENVPEARERFSDQFKYVMVDEYQDTNFLQADIIRLLSGKHRNILAVGDDAQSIYSFRGARVENILEFPKQFSESKLFKLEVNYRSTPEILNLANDSLTNNDNQFDKILKAVNSSLEIPALVEVKDPFAQAKFIAQRILEFREEGVAMKNMAILFRAHYQSAELEMELVKRDIPYIIRGGIRFFEQAHIKDVLAYMRIVVNPLDEIAWIRVLSLCPGIGSGYATNIFQYFHNSGRDLIAFIRSEDLTKVVSKKAQEGYKRFRKIMNALLDPASEKTPGEIIPLILDEGYETYILANFENGKDRIDDIYELVNFSNDYDSMGQFLNDMTLREGFKGETNLSDSEDEEQLVLSTIHQAKGLEWDIVMIIGLSEGQFPHPKAMDNDREMEEERRLFYVASTRAKKYLYLLHPMTRFDYQKGTVMCRRSRFLEELDPGDYEVWQVDSSGNTYDDDFDDAIIEM